MCFKCYDEVGVTYKRISEITALAVSGCKIKAFALHFGVLFVKIQ